MIKYLLFTVCITFANTAMGQGDKFKVTDKDFGISVAYIYQGDNFATIGGIVGKNVGNPHVPGWSYGLATEFNFRNDSFIIGAKSFFDINLIAIGLRLNAINYFKGPATDFRLTPEIGLTGNSLFNIYYGYNIPTAGTELREISRSRLNITVNLFRNIY